MYRKTLVLALVAAAALAGQANAQIIVGGLLPVQPGKVPNADLGQAVGEVFQQLAAMQRRPGVVSDGTITWGGVRLTKAEAVLQQQLGLGETEGMVIAAVEPNSVAEKAGLKANDVLVKIKDQSVPSDLDGFTKLVKDQKVDEGADMVVVRNGKEETLKAAKMPTLVQATVPERPAFGGKGGFGGIAIGKVLQIKPGKLKAFNPGGPNVVQNLRLEMTIDGAKIVRTQDTTKYAGEYTKDDLKITVSGKIENGVATTADIAVTVGRETTKYANPKEVPQPHRQILLQLMPASTLIGS